MDKNSLTKQDIKNAILIPDTIKYSELTENTVYKTQDWFIRIVNYVITYYDKDGDYQTDKLLVK